MTIEVRHDSFEAGASGELTGVASATQMPNIPCRMAIIKARAINPGDAYVGWTSGVTVADGSTDTTTGLELDANDQLGPIAISNLNQLWYICDSTDDNLTYFVMK